MVFRHQATPACHVRQTSVSRRRLIARAVAVVNLRLLSRSAAVLTCSEAEQISLRRCVVIPPAAWSLHGRSQINLADNVLTIRGETKSERDEKTYRLVERSNGSF